MSRSAAPSIYCLPSADIVFAAAVRRVVEDLDAVTPAALEAGIRVVYPNAIVRRRSVVSRGAGPELAQA